MHTLQKITDNAVMFKSYGDSRQGGTKYNARESLPPRAGRAVKSRAVARETATHQITPCRWGYKAIERASAAPQITERAQIGVPSEYVHRSAGGAKSEGACGAACACA